MSPAHREIVNTALGFDLSDEQWIAVSAELEPAVIVAGAGTGKTTSMAARVAYLVSRGVVQPERILGLTFTNKAASSLLRTVRKVLGADVFEPAPGALDVPGVDVQAMTYHAFAARIVRDHGIRLGIEPHAEVLSDAARAQLAYRCVTSAPTEMIIRSDSPSAMAQRVLALDDALNESRVSIDELVAFDEELVDWLRTSGGTQNSARDLIAASEARLTTARLVGAFRELKRERDVVDFADQIRLAVDLVDTYPDLCEILRSEFDVVLLDEYQDTSVAQRILLQKIFGEGHAVTAVGDPCQAIYGWRGASADNIDSFLAHFGGDENSSYPLSENRRSGLHIVEAANTVAEPLRGIHRTAEPLAAVATAHGPGDVRVGLFETWDQELAWLTESISQQHKSLEAGETIAVLAGTGAVLDKVDRALRGRGIPTQVHGAAAMLHQPAVQDLLSWLRVIHEPTANAALLRILSGPRWRIGPRDLAALGNRAAELTGGPRRRNAKTLDEALTEALDGSDSVDVVSLSDALLDLGDPGAYSPEAIERFAEIALLLRELRGCTGEPLGELLARVSHRTMIGVEAQVTDPSGTQREALSAFAALADDFTDLDGRVGLGGFLSRITDAERMEISTKLDVIVRPGAVQLMSIHKSKGLEFTHVYLPSVTSGGFPGGQARRTWVSDPSVVPWPLRHDSPIELPTYPPRDQVITKKELDAYKDALKAIEEREVDRLSYVALTRAQASVAVTAHWWGPTQKRLRGPHRFAVAVQAVPAATIIEWFPEPDKDAHNPSITASEHELTWPIELSGTYLDQVRATAERVRAVDTPEPFANADSEIQRWFTLAQALREESQRASEPERVVSLGPAVGASTFLRALAEPEEVARDLLRPMPRKPSAAARRGTAWHAWVEARYGQQSLLDPDDLPGAADESIISDEQLARLKEAFELTAYANLAPVAVEQPFSLMVGGRLVHGRIDAVFESAGYFDVIDWKTGGTEHLDPRQLAIYRLAWARIAGVAWEDVRAGFVMVSSGEIIRPDTDGDIQVFLASDS